MSLHPQVADMLARLAALGQPPLEETTPAEARKNMRLRMIGLGKPEPVAAVEDFTAPVDGGEIPVRLYRPSLARSLPVLVYFHGGGWVIGDLVTHDGLCRALANASGFAVASAEYRLAPEHCYPTAAEDAFVATRWVVDNAAKLGVDACRVAVGGDSAGGNLAAVVALMARDRGGPPLRSQLLLYPVTDCDLDTASYLEHASGYGLTRAGMRWFWEHYVPDAARRTEPYASPLRAVDLRGLPPACVVTAEHDVLRDEGEAYARKLAASDVPAVLKRYDGMIHGFLRLTGAVDRAREAVGEIGEELRRRVG
jgi:acetyl esterase